MMKINFFQHHSLKTRVTLFTLAIFLVSIWTLSFYASRMLREDMRRLLGQHQFSAVSILAAEINQEIIERFNSLQTVAESITPDLMHNTANLHKLLEARLILKHQFNAGTFIIRHDGTIIAELKTSGSRIGRDSIDREIIATALNAGKSSVGQPVMGNKLSAPVFGMAVPILDLHGKIIGALIGMTSLGETNFLEHFTTMPYGKSGGHMLVARPYRLIVIATDKSRIMQQLPAAGINPTIDRFIDGYEGHSIYVNQLGEKVMTATKLIPAANWVLGSSLPTIEAFAPILSMQQRILIASLILSLLAGGLTWWMLRRQLFPMMTTMQTLTKLTESSQLPQSLPVTRQDEIGQLITSFNHLLEILKQREEEVRQLAYYDQLTRLPNRRLLADHMKHAMAASKRSGKFAALIFLDLDNFKPLNDLHGHEAGDLLLIEAATRLKTCVREMDTVARFGGDEFVVLLSELNTDRSESTTEAGIVAQKIGTALAQPYHLTVTHEGLPDIHVEHLCTASIGVALFINHEARESDILKWADSAMYQAKDEGRNLIRFHHHVSTN